MNNIFTDTNGDNDILIHNLNKDNILIILKYLNIPPPNRKFLTKFYLNPRNLTTKLYKKNLNKFIIFIPYKKFGFSILCYLFILIKIYLFYVMIQLNFQILVQQKVLMIY